MKENMHISTTEILTGQISVSESISTRELLRLSSKNTFSTFSLKSLAVAMFTKLDVLTEVSFLINQCQSIQIPN